MDFIIHGIWYWWEDRERISHRQSQSGVFLKKNYTSPITKSDKVANLLPALFQLLHIVVLQLCPAQQDAGLVHQRKVHH